MCVLNAASVRKGIFEKVLFSSHKHTQWLRQARTRRTWFTRMAHVNQHSSAQLQHHCSLYVIGLIKIMEPSNNSRENT